MGVLNVTPDSFSDGGRFLAFDAAVAHGLQMAEDGADLVDVGGESTRPGAEPVEAKAEIERVIPVVQALAAAGVLVSIDTSKAVVAEAAVEAGAAVVNDVSSLSDPAMATLVARSGVGVVLMHMAGEPRTMQQDPRFDDVVAEVADSLVDRAEWAIAQGIDPERICLDPGIGFGKTVAHNLDLIAMGVERIAASGYPVLVGASRKSFIETVLGPIALEDRDGATVAAHVLAIAAGAAAVRTHNVVEGLRSARIADAIVRGEAP
jgi:dihydropteroate synthase